MLTPGQTSGLTPAPPPGLTRRLAAVDCGTNSIRLLVADVDPASGAQRDVVRRMEVVRLGEGLDVTGAISAAALDRALARCREYAQQCRELGVEEVRFVATSAARGAANAGDFLVRVEEAFGSYRAWPEVIDGEREASLSFAGAVTDVAAVGLPAPYLVVDLGGGSTEFVMGRDASDPAASQGISVDMGCVRFTERYLHSDPPTPTQLQAARAVVDAELDRVVTRLPVAGLGTVVGVAGSVLTIGAHAIRLREYDESRLHLLELPPHDWEYAARDLLTMTRAERAELPFMHPGRVDVIGAGALIWERIVARLAPQAGAVRVLASTHDILDGVIAEHAHR